MFHASPGFQDDKWLHLVVIIVICNSYHNNGRQYNPLTLSRTLFSMSHALQTFVHEEPRSREGTLFVEVIQLSSAKTLYNRRVENFIMIKKDVCFQYKLHMGSSQGAALLSSTNMY